MGFDYRQERISWAKGDAIRDAGLQTPDDIERIDNLQYGSDPKWNVLDIYRPKGNRNLLPVIISVHGGGWFYGDKDLYQHYTMRLAQRGFAVINYTYRLAPEHKYPAPLEDAAMVFDFIAQHHEEYRLDISNTFMVGDSAGAQLNYQINIIRTNPKYASLFDFRFNSAINVRAVALNCGIYTFMVTPFGLPSVMQTYLKEDWKKDYKTYAFGKFVTKDFPPAYIMGGYGDGLKIFAKPLYFHLKLHGVESVCRIYGNSKNKDSVRHVFHVDCNNEIGKACNDDECDFFRNRIKQSAHI